MNLGWYGVGSIPSHSTLPPQCQQNQCGSGRGEPSLVTVERRLFSDGSSEVLCNWPPYRRGKQRCVRRRRVGNGSSRNKESKGACACLEESALCVRFNLL